MERASTVVLVLGVAFVLLGVAAGALAPGALLPLIGLGGGLVVVSAVMSFGVLVSGR